MIERHYDEEALVTMLDSGANASDPHLGSCARCSEAFDSYRLVTATLRDAAMWDKRVIDETPNPNTIATLRAFAANMAAQDSAAEAFLADLLAGPRETWTATLAAHPEQRTPGTVRRLITAADRALDSMPADAVAISTLATEIAENLDPATHRPDTVARLRGSAWRERAYALFFTGQIADAQRAISASERHFCDCLVDQYELARVGIVKALVDRALEDFALGSTAARESAERFEEFGDIERMVSARVAEAQLQCGLADYAGAFATLKRLDEQISKTDALETRAIVLSNLGYCAGKLGRMAEAIQFHQTSAVIFEDLGGESGVMRARASIAALLATQGNIDEALARLSSLHQEFASRGMAGVAADVGLHLSELLVERGRFAEAQQICRAVMEYVASAGLRHTEPALTALAIMREAVANRTATTKIVKHVREYLRRLPSEPALLFAPPPEG